MSKERISKSKICELLMEKAEKHARPIRITEFTCPYCQGVAATWIDSGFVKAECYCCSTKGYRNLEPVWRRRHK